MKVSVLDELFLGDWVPPIGATTKKEGKIADTLSSLYKKIGKSLNDEQSKFLEDLDREKDELRSEEERKCFKVGVRLGFLFAVEAFGMDVKNL